jgi:5-formyltetrahydrofolate cyclo-ligase
VNDDPVRDETAALKPAARERACAARDALAPETRAAAGASIRANLLALPERERAQTVMAFASFRTEIDTRPLIELLLGRGVVVALPRIVAPRLMTALRVTDLDADLVPGRFGIPTPHEGLEEIPPDTFDCVVVPGSAFDDRGRRVGYGGGFYDAFLPRTRPGCLWVAPLFEAQLTDEVPTEPHDLTMPLLVTEKRVIDLRS